MSTLSLQAPDKQRLADRHTARVVKGEAYIGRALGIYDVANAGSGIDNPSASNLAVGARSRDQNYFGNFIYELNSNVKFSLEYRRLTTAFRNQPIQTGRANQVTLSAAYQF